MPQQLVFTGDSPYFEFQATIDGTTYTHQCRWNNRIDAWFMDVLDETGQTVLMAGLRLVADWPFPLYFTGHQPPGVYVCVDTSGEHIDPGLNDLGVRCILIYYTIDELNGVSTGG